MIISPHTLISLMVILIDNTESPSVVAGVPRGRNIMQKNKLDAFLDKFESISMLTGYAIYVLWAMFRENYEVGQSDK